MLKRIGLLIGFLLYMLSSACFGQIVAQCSDPKGYGYYPYMGLVPENNTSGLHAGWNEDGITGGLFQLNMIDEKKL